MLWARVFWAAVALIAWIYVLFTAPGWGKALSIMVAVGFWELNNRHDKS